MAATSKFDFPSNSPDGPAHQNGQRGPHAMASLERVGSFREGMESRTPSSLQSMSRNGSVSSQGDMSNLLQSLVSDMKAVVPDQKFFRAGEIKRSISSIVGVSPEDSLPAMVNTRPLTASSLEEIKRIRSSLHEYAAKASDRSKVFGEATSKIDKYYHNLPKKRSRVDNSSSDRSNVALQGGNIPKNGPQSHLSSSGIENGPQKSEEKAKSAVPNRRIRTSMAEMDVRANGIARPPGNVDRDRDVFKLANGGATPSEEKGRALPPGVDGWEKSKMKKKRSIIKSDISASVIPARPPDGDRESKKGLQQKLVTDARSRLNSTHGFRSGPVTGIVGKLDSTSQPNGIGMRPFPRGDQDNGSFPNERRDRIGGSDKEGTTLKAVGKPNSRDDNCVGSPTVTKVNASARGPRSNSGSMAKASPNINRTLGNADDWEQPQGVNKLNSVGVTSRKRSASTCSTSPPVTQWGGQRPQKISRVARRSNLPPVVSSHDEYPVSEIVGNAIASDDGLGFAIRLSTNASQQSKTKSDNGISTVLSESEESVIADNKSKDKSKKCNEIEEKTGASAQRVGPLVLPSRKNKVTAEEDVVDGVRKHGKIGRGFTPGRSGMPATIEKPDNAVTAKQMRSSRVSYEKIESKPGRPPTKKWSERKGHTRPRQSVNSSPLDIAGESYDDHEELLAAVKAALDTSRACSSSFWKQFERVFSFLSVEDREFLNQQIRLTDESSASTCITGYAKSPKAELDCDSLPSTPSLFKRDGCGGPPSEIISISEFESDLGLASQAKHIEPFLEQLGPRNGAQNGISICQVLLSAIIEEEEIAKYNYKNSEGGLYGGVRGSHFEIDGEIKRKGPERAAPNAYRANTGWRYHDELVHEDLGSNGSLDELLVSIQTTSATISNEFEYAHMCIDDRILLELSEIGLHPDPVPHLAQSEDEDIVVGINRLEEMLEEQVTRKKRMLVDLQKAVMEAREPQQRELEHIALDRLVGIAYEKYMQAFGPNGSKNMSRSSKQAILAFVRQTLARCKKYDETRSSCFSELPFRDMLCSSSSRSSDAECTDNAADLEAAHQFASARHSDISLADPCLASESVQRVNIHDKYSDAFRSVNQLTEQASAREEQWSNRLKKRELLLDDVVNSAVGGAFNAPLGLGGPLVSGTKGKRSERDREGKGQNRDSLSRNGNAKIGQPALSNAKGERKNKSKPKQKTTQLSASVNGLLGKATETSKSASKLREVVLGGNHKEESGLVSSYAVDQDLSNDAEAIDLCNLQLPEIDVADFGGQGQDIATWLNIEEDGLQDHDFMGLEIPMDDLSEVNMMI